jgi:hypothetical protein
MEETMMRLQLVLPTSIANSMKVWSGLLSLASRMSHLNFEVYFLDVWQWLGKII